MAQRRINRRVRETFGSRLRAFRKERRLSQERLGAKSGLSGKFIGECERSEKSISIDSLFRVAGALDVPLRVLTDLDGAKPNPDLDAITAMLARKPLAVVRMARRVVKEIAS